MKVILFNGSPNEKGCTYTALAEVEKSLSAAGVETEIFFIGRQPVKGCIGCGTCAIGAYDQDRLDELLGFLPGPSAEKNYSCAVYAAPVGKRISE